MIMCNYQMLVERSVSNRVENRESEDGMMRKKFHLYDSFQKSDLYIYSDLIHQNNVIVYDYNQMKTNSQCLSRNVI